MNDEATAILPRPFDHLAARVCVLAVGVACPAVSLAITEFRQEPDRVGVDSAVSSFILRPRLPAHAPDRVTQRSH